MQEWSYLYGIVFLKHFQRPPFFRECQLWAQGTQIVPFFGGRQKSRKSKDFTLKFSVLIHQIFLYPLHVGKMILMKTILVFVQSMFEKFS
jgi:hypothetical protein